MLLLLASLLILILGPVLYRVAGERHRAVAILDGVVVVSVGLVVIVQILPHAIDQAGWMVSVPLVLGLLGPTMIERWLSAIEDRSHLTVLAVVVFGLGLHALTDGVALSLARSTVPIGAETDPGGSLAEHLPVAVVLHRIPTSLVIWRLLGRDGTRYRAVGALVGIAGATVVGYIAGPSFAAHLATPMLGIFQAFVAGSLLHVAVHSLQAHAAHRRGR